MFANGRIVLRQAASSVVEQLEQRRMLSSSVASSLKPDTDPDFNILVVTGTKNKDYITVFDDPEDNSAVVWNDKNHNNNEDSGETKEYDDADLDGVFIDAQQGDDTVNFVLESEYDGAQRSVQVDLSDGNDKFTFESIDAFGDASNGTGFIDHASFNLEVDGQEKNDTIDIDLNGMDVDESNVFVNVDAGAGNDKVSLELGEAEAQGVTEPQQTLSGGSATDYTQIQVQIDLGSGNNLYEQSLFSDIDFAQLTINVNGGSGKDTVQDTEDYLLEEDSAIFETVNLEGGNDYYNGDFGLVGIAGGSEANYNIQGGDGNDRMTFEDDQSDSLNGLVKPAEPQIESDVFVEGILQVNMYGGTGNDTMDMWNDGDDVVSPNAKPTGKAVVKAASSDPMNPLLIDTFEGGDVRVVMSGDAGNDKVLLNLGATEDSNGDYDLSVLGAAGKDTVAAGFVDETLFLSQLAKPALGTIVSSVTFGPSGAILVDGGRDTDTYQVNGTPFTPFSVRSCEIESDSLLPIDF